MAFRQSGYGRTAGIARRTDSDFTGMADVPAQLLEPVTSAQGQQGFSSQASSAAGIPGFYTSQYGYPMTAPTYRRLTALTTSNPGIIAQLQNGDTNALKLWAAAQGDTMADGERFDDVNKRLAVKAEAASQLGGFKVHLEPNDVSVIEQHRKEELALTFDQWVTRKIDIADPHNSKWLQEIHPDFYARREAYIDAKINLEARLAKIRARGIRGQDDLKLLFAVDTGMVTPSTQPLFLAAPQRSGIDFMPGWLSVPGYFYRRTPAGNDRLGRQPHDILQQGFAM